MNEENTHIDKAIKEYEYIYRKLRFVKSCEAKGEMVKGISMKARDLAREATPPTNYPQFVFTITTFNVDAHMWDACPGCGGTDIIHETDGHIWKGCFNCRVLLDDKKAQIRAMLPPGMKDKKKKAKEEPFGHKVEDAPISDEPASQAPEQPPV